MTRVTRWTADRVALLVRLREQDKLPWAAIAERFGTSEKYVQGVYRTKHLIPTHAQRPSKPKQADLMRDRAMGRLIDRIAELESQVNRLLDHCPDGECPTCAAILCPHGDALHFHHDGCPSCAQWEQHGELA